MHSALVLCVVAAIAGACLCDPGVAVATDVTQQGVVGYPFTFTALPSTLELADDDDGGQELRLAVTGIERIGPGSPLYTDPGVLPDPRSIQPLSSGTLLYADRNAKLVAEVTRVGEPVWTYTVDDDPDLQRPFCAQRFTRDGRELTLISDRWAARVWAVDAQKNIVWQYGTINETGVSVNHLADPFYAEYSSADGGTVLVADCNEGGNRVIEIRYSDYVAGASDNGFTAESIVWSYGTPGVEGTGPNELDKPHCAQRLASGNVLITDADGARVFEVDRATKETVWQYGVSGAPGKSAGHLSDPNHAMRLSDGDTLIVDTGSGRVLRVSASGAIDKVYDLNTQGRPPWATSTDEPDPRAAAYAEDGLLAVADTQLTQIVLLGYDGSASAVSSNLECGGPGVDKAFVSLTWKGSTSQSGTNVAVDYRLDDAEWQSCGLTSGSRRYDFPAGTHGEAIAYRVTLTSTNPGHTPTLDSITIQSTEATTGGDGGGGGGSGGSGNSGGSGTYSYPASAAGGTGTTGTGTGSGSYGTGTGSGSSGTGSGSAGSGSGSSSSTSSLQPPVQSSGSGSAQAVRGFQVEGQEGVSGVPLKAAEGPQAPQPDSPGPPVPVLALIGAGLAVAAALFVPWPFVAARIRGIAGFDHTRPKYRGPLGSLWK